MADSLKDGTIDAFFSVSGWPQSAVADLAATIGIELVPIDGPEVDKLIKQFSFFSKRGDPRRRLQGRRRREDRERARDLGDLEQADRGADLQGHRRAVEPGDAQAARLGPRQGPRDPARDGDQGLGIPLHPGAEKFYKEQGLIK